MNKQLNKDKKEFVMNSKTFFLTYSRCKLQKRTMFNRLKKIVNARNAKIIYFIICEEEHKATDSSQKLSKPNFHYHVLLILDKQIFIRKPDFFDINNVHPNIESARSPGAVRNYILKYDSNYLESGVWDKLRVKKSTKDVSPKKNNRASVKTRSLLNLIENGLNKKTIGNNPEILFHLDDINRWLKYYRILPEGENIDNENKIINSSKINKLIDEFKYFEKSRIESTSNEADFENSELYSDIRNSDEVTCNEKE